jgi:hypothetical protein
MPDQSGDRAKQQMWELSEAVRKAAREIDRAYPSTTQGDRILSDFQQHTTRIIQSGRQRSSRSTGVERSPFDDADQIRCGTYLYTDEPSVAKCIGVFILALFVFVLVLLIVCFFAFM